MSYVPSPNDYTGEIAHIGNINAALSSSGSSSISVPALTSTVAFYGDSITAGNGVTGEQRWTTVLSGRLGLTEINYGVSGAQWGDALDHIFDNHVAGRTSIISYGVNDIVTGQIYWDAIQRNIEALALYTCLPSSCIVNARSANCTKVGTWVNTAVFTSIGMNTTGVGTSISTTVSGRYVGFSTTNTNAMIPTSTFSMAVTIDGVVIQSALKLICKYTTTTLGITYLVDNYIYDTGVNGAHTISVAPTKVGSFASEFYMNYFFGFNANQTNASTVLLNSVAFYDQCGVNAALASSEFARLACISAIENVARKLRYRYGLPVFFIKDSGDFNLGDLQNDLIHLNIQGNKHMADNVEAVIKYGEVNYISS